MPFRPEKIANAKVAEKKRKYSPVRQNDKIEIVPE